MRHRNCPLHLMHLCTLPWKVMRVKIVTKNNNKKIIIFTLLCPRPLGGDIKRWCCLTSVWRLASVCLTSVAYRTKSRTERARKTKIGTEVAQVTRDSDTTFKVKRSRSPGRLVACSNHYLTYMDDNIVYAIAQSAPLPVDLGAGAYRGGRPPTACY